jgi:hypothetical protein
VLMLGLKNKPRSLAALEPNPRDRHLCIRMYFVNIAVRTGRSSFLWHCLRSLPESCSPAVLPLFRDSCALKLKAPSLSSERFRRISSSPGTPTLQAMQTTGYLHSTRFPDLWDKQETLSCVGSVTAVSWDICHDCCNE